MRIRSGAILLLGFLFACSTDQVKEATSEIPFLPAPGHWPQWQGPNRDNVSTETGLLKEWPPGGPKLLWRAAGAGDGVGPVSIAGGLIFALGSKENKHFLTAFDGSGRLMWERPVGPKTGEYALMRFLGQCAPTVDDDRVYVVTAQGNLLCLRSSNGDLLWQKDYSKDLAGKVYYVLGYRESPLVDGDRLICTPGGSLGTLAALNKRTGAVLWRSSELKDSTPNSSIVAAELGGVRQYVVFTMNGLAGIDAKTGRLLWRTELKAMTMIATTPIVHDNIVLISSGYGFGCKAFKVEKEGSQFKVSLLYEGRQAGGHRAITRLGEYCYVADGLVKCFEFKTGNLAWTFSGPGSSNVLIADGSLIAKGGYTTGALALYESDPKAGRERSRFETSDAAGEGGLSHLAIAGGRLYARKLDTISCYDLRGPEYQEPPPVWRIKPEPPRIPSQDPGEGTDAAFVPTPQDVVEKMIAVASLSRDDLVFDLGSGDGRIVIAASAAHGCRSVGYEINPSLVKESRAKVTEARLEDRVSIVEQNLFSVDLKPASVIMLYLGTPNNGRLLPKFRQLKAGTRIVSHAHLLGDEGPKPDQEFTILSKEDGIFHTLHVWKIPFSLGK